jgi:hypothetical protein
MAQDLEQKLRDVVARQEILNLSYRYARAQDRLDAKAHRSVFFDDAWLDYGFYVGGPDEFVAFAQGALKDMEVTQHLQGQIDIEIQGDTAFGEVYYIAYHRITRDGKPADLIVAGRYIDRYECRQGVWKIAFRSELVDWSRIDPASGSFFELMPKALSTRRGEVDLADRRQDLYRPGTR